MRDVGYCAPQPRDGGFVAGGARGGGGGGGWVLVGGVRAVL